MLIGVSTGATLALAVSGRPEMQAVAALVMISPNFAPRSGPLDVFPPPPLSLVNRTKVL